MFKSEVHMKLFTKLFFALFISLALLSPIRTEAQQNPTTTQQPARQPKPSQQPSAQTGQQQAQPKEDPDISGDDVLRVETDLTNILLTVLDRDHRFLTTLKQEDLRILENGVAQDISIFQRETDLPLTIAILIDTSKSQERSLPDEKSAAIEFVQSVIRPDRDRAAIVSFTGDATVEQALTNDTQALKTAINRVRIVLPPEKGAALDDQPEIPPEQDPRGWTGIWDAGWATITEMLQKTPENTRRAIILLTDGDDTSSKTKKKELVDLANRFNVAIYSIGVEDKAEYPSDEGALRKVSDGTGGRAFFPLNKGELQAAFAQIQQELRSQYLIAYSPKNKAHDNAFRQVRIEVLNPELRKQKLKLLYRQGYYYKQQSQKKIQ